MRILITDVLTAECELTGKKDVECVRVVLHEAAPEAVIAMSELIRLLRFQKKQHDKAEAAKSLHITGANTSLVLAYVLYFQKLISDVFSAIVDLES